MKKKSTDKTVTVNVIIKAQQDKTSITLGNRKISPSRKVGLYPSLQWVLDKGNKLITDWEPEEVAASRETVQESQNYSSMVAHMILPLDRSEYKFTEVSSLSHKAPASNTQEGHYNKTSMLAHKVAEVDNWEEEVHASQEFVWVIQPASLRCGKK